MFLYMQSFSPIPTENKTASRETELSKNIKLKFLFKFYLKM